MEFELYLYSLGEKKSKINAQIFLHHKNTHEHASHVISFMEKEEYLLALTYLEEMLQPSLLLKDYIKTLQMEYMRDKEENFFNFIDHKTKLEKDFYFFVSILFNSNQLQVQEFLLESAAELERELIQLMKKNALEGVVYVGESSIDVLCKSSSKMLQPPALNTVNEHIHEYIKEKAQSHELQTQTVGVNIDEIYTVNDNISSMLRMIKKYDRSGETMVLKRDGISKLYKAYLAYEHILETVETGIVQKRFGAFFSTHRQCKERQSASVCRNFDTFAVSGGLFACRTVFGGYGKRKQDGRGGSLCFG
jgi:hypothetical protein